MMAAMGFLSKAILFPLLLINTCQNALSFSIRSTPDHTLNRPPTAEWNTTMGRIFDILDRDKNHTLSMDEIMYPVSQDKLLVKHAFSVFDKNQDGKVELTEVEQVASVYFKNATRLRGFIFMISDMDNDGFVSSGEMRQVLGTILDAYHLNDSKLQQYVDEKMESADKDRDGRLNSEEYVNSNRTESYFQFVFRVCDLNGDEFVSNDEALIVMDKLLSPYNAMNDLRKAILDSKFSECDTNKDGRISTIEFYANGRVFEKLSFTN